ncbi:MAG: hypothetical protein R3B67_04260 [Phycisphaerales bacterium]
MIDGLDDVDAYFEEHPHWDDEPEDGSEPDIVRQALVTKRAELAPTKDRTIRWDEYNQKLTRWLVPKPKQADDRTAARLIHQVRLHHDPNIRYQAMELLIELKLLDQFETRELLIMLVGECEWWGHDGEELCTTACDYLEAVTPFGFEKGSTPCLTAKERLLAAKSITKIILEGIQGKFGEDGSYTTISRSLASRLHLEELVAQELCNHDHIYIRNAARAVDEIFCDQVHFMTNPEYFRGIVDHLVFNQHQKLSELARAEVARGLITLKSELEEAKTIKLDPVEPKDTWGLINRRVYHDGLKRDERMLRFLQKYRDTLTLDDFDRAKAKIKK